MNYNPERAEKIHLTFRHEQDSSRRTLEIILPSRLAIAFGWWMSTHRTLKA